MVLESRRTMLLITYSEEIVNGESIHVSSNSLPTKALNFEPAGRSFHSAALRLLGQLPKDKNSAADDNNVFRDEKERVYVESSHSYGTKGKKAPKDSKQQDHYALLGLSHLRYLATEDQIKKNYREVALRHHPDKQTALVLAEKTEAAKEAKKDLIESHFKQIQEAYEVLGDPVRRRIYDSTDDFDDEIPYDCAPQDFFNVFGPAFLRNGRWSLSQPIPTLGDGGTPLEEVDRFYDFWYSFKSWREFPHEEEFNLEEAESREHRRWMERQNAKLSEKARKEEYARIRTLVDNAIKRDPRILRRKEEQKAEKQRKKETKVMAKKLQEQEAARIAEEERQRKEVEEKEAAETASNLKRLKEKEKRLLRKERTRLRTLSAPVLSQHLLDLIDDDVESLCLSLDKELLKDLCDRMESVEGLDRAELLREVLCVGHKPKDDDKNLHQNGSTSMNGQVSHSNYKEKPWSREEIELLRKGMQKYPKGISRRWEVISEYIGAGRTVEEILKARTTVLLPKPDSAKAFDSFLENRKSAPTIASPFSTRDEMLGLSNDNKSKDNSSVSVIAPEPPTDQNQSKVKSDAANGVALSMDKDSWSVVQEQALVQALKTFPKETPQRWDRIAAAVPDKTINRCKKKFKQMKENLKSSDNKTANADDSQTHNDAVNGISSISEGGIWSGDQEKASIQVLKVLPKDTAQRWERVAASVPGKTVEACKKKVSSLKESIRSKKN